MKTTIIFLAATLMVVGMPFAAADETHADCEDGQAFIGYRTTQSLHAAYVTAGSPGGLFVCEGEHWDGQDSVRGDEAGTTDCLQNPQVDPSGFVALCANSDINEGDADPTLAASPVAFRVSNAGSEAYVGTNIFSVGRAVVYTDGEGMVGIYLRDNTPGNVLATVVSSAGITKGYPSEDDCDQATYEVGAYDLNPDTARTHCGRDNTAITLYVLS